MVDLLTHATYLGLVVGMVLTGMGLPIPEEVFIISAGVASSLGELNPWGAFLACFAGAILGDSFVYAVGYHFGRRILREHPWWARVLHAEREERIERMIRRHGLKVFFVNRFLIGIRAPVYLTAGILRMPFHRFLLADATSAAVVVGLFFGLSYRYGKPIGEWLREGQYALTALVIGGILAAVGIFFWRRRRQAAVAALVEAAACDAPEERSPSNEERVA